MDDNVIHMVRTQHLAAIHAVCLVLVLIAHKRFTNRNSINVPTRDSMLHRQEVREEMLHDLLTSGKCCQLIRMSENAFKILCQKLQSEGETDGTYVRMRVPIKDAPRYHGRKGYPTINVLAACTFDLKFIYVLSGWEGTTSDSRIIKDALTRKDKLIIPNGKFYLENPNTAKLRTKPIHHYNELMKLFGKDRATCEASETAKERKNRMKQDEQPVETIDDIDQLLETNEISLENFTAGDNDHLTPQVQLTNTLPSKSKKRKLKEDA
ncbi:putative nuclease HARBI1 [Tanacetum coccineum]